MNRIPTINNPPQGRTVAVVGDVYRYRAALAGYDAIHVDGQSNRHAGSGKGFYAILNWSVLTVQKESAKRHVIQ